MKLYQGDKLGLDAVAPIKCFTPDSCWAYYFSEFDGCDLLYGVIIGQQEIEFVFITLSELEKVKGPLGLPIERDFNYEPKTFKELIEALQKERY
jgi:hypothetical protein